MKKLTQEEFIKYASLSIDATVDVVMKLLTAMGENPKDFKTQWAYDLTNGQESTLKFTYQEHVLLDAKFNGLADLMASCEAFVYGFKFHASFCDGEFNPEVLDDVKEEE